MRIRIGLCFCQIPPAYHNNPDNMNLISTAQEYRAR